ncbi:phosphoadenosine phosphosulfate reductase domain-containing protein [Noviherbaspirillum pedocola]|uniref:Phosphoadenosine phosphosulfate reductase family protein n=1 Tax=Noviherbaspirillum pedocola TaxID=2801341 RepID=A0A934SUY9_9BURK|nr:phosphoadenosine phosphosulfate reductase family protein [Noviherbaspirillum pedocola]MBK4736054.1 phosphoadenosine phosphosulfate reductase family protein [Noviherbaspirillum pedocola]
MNAVVDLGALLTEAAREEQTIDLHSYDHYYVAVSGGKDSLALVLYLLDHGVPTEKIEIHHHSIDGENEGSFMDWPVTNSYVEAFARHFGLKFFKSYRMGGFEREMLRENSLTAPVAFDSEAGTVKVRGGKRGELSTRRKYPQVTSDLQKRYCSPALKIDVAKIMLCNEPRFRNSRTLVLTGERAEESASRATYRKFERHRADKRDSPKLRRHVDVLRAVHDWPEAMVWDIMRRYRIRPHPAYQLGWSRCSCRTCIFGDKDQWATVREYFPLAFNKVAGYEREFGVTIHRKLTVNQQADLGTPYDCDPEIVALANSTVYTPSIIWEDWQLPAGAFRNGCGPT